MDDAFTGEMAKILSPAGRGGYPAENLGILSSFGD